MSSPSDTKAEDSEAVKAIVNKLKSQGLFDKFRKECLGDVDTKPAYQNLRQRVEGYVSRFLSKQQWTPNLSKNQLRDSLRKHINQSGMLANGVERIIEQVVNPRIMQVLKPKIDEVVCEHYGIDIKVRQQKIQEKKNKHMQNVKNLLNSPPPSQSTNSVRPLMSISPCQDLEDSSAWQQQQQQQQQTQQLQQQQQQMSIYQMPPNMNFGLPMGFDQSFPYGMQQYPYLPSMWPAGYPGMPPFSIPPPGVMPQPDMSIPPPSSAMSMSTPQYSNLNNNATTTPAEDVVPPPPPESFPPLPCRNEESSITQEIIEKNLRNLELEKLKEAENESGKTADKMEEPTQPDDSDINKDEPSGITLTDIPLPPQGPTNNNQGAEKREDEDENVITLGDEKIIVNEENAEKSNKSYKFAWSKDVDELSDVSVSTIHTSDLSSFEDLDSLSSNSDIDDDDGVAKETTTESAKETTETDMNVSQTETADDSSPMKAPPPPTSLPPPLPPLPETDIKRSLSKLQQSFSYSDSEDNESMEERKLKTAKDKRYQKRKKYRLRP